MCWYLVLFIQCIIIDASSFSKLLLCTQIKNLISTRQADPERMMIKRWFDNRAIK